MLRYDLINKSWIVGPHARRAYRAAAILSLFLLPVVLAIKEAYPVPIYLRQLLLLTLLGTSLNCIGMEYFLFRFDDSGALKQIFWFFVMLFVPFGPALYCFIVYSRSKGHERSLIDGGNEIGVSSENRLP